MEKLENISEYLYKHKIDKDLSCHILNGIIHERLDELLTYIFLEASICDKMKVIGKNINVLSDRQRINII